MPENTHIKVKDGIIKICDFAFSGCTSLTNIELPAATTIGGYAFNKCYNLISMTIGTCYGYNPYSTYNNIYSYLLYGL